ncbi:GDSL/SGNH-like acyl-esterase family found in Pmr5 and Cas1p-domain-containing protein [Dichotomocladium elegans]|nr:GDSL/SGNH-like acyl-esterase family found in Pmr5 and Cas1p-domain-containing protein [Dichotomocladium elegans]
MPFKSGQSPHSKSSLHPYYVWLVAILVVFGLALVAWPSMDDIGSARILSTSSSPDQLPSPMPSSDKDAFYDGPDSMEEDGEICTIAKFNQGEWKHNPIGDVASPKALEKVTEYHCHGKFHHRCYERSASELERAKKMLDYTWIPSCTVYPFDSQKFAEHLAEHPLLLVGDSITDLQFQSLACLLGEYLERPTVPEKIVGVKGTKVRQLVWRGSGEEKSQQRVAIAFVRSDTLVRLDDLSVLKPGQDEGYRLSQGQNAPWLHLVPHFKYVIINTGPHWRSNAIFGKKENQQEMLKAYKKAMSNVLDGLKHAVEPWQRVYFRTTPYGHVNCSQYNGPLASVSTPSREPYEWNMFVKFDDVYKDIISRADDERFVLFDVSFTNFRGDAHSVPDRDCLHYCIPGPVDVWNRLLYHEFTKRITQAAARSKSR